MPNEQTRNAATNGYSLRELMTSASDTGDGVLADSSVGVAARLHTTANRSAGDVDTHDRSLTMAGASTPIRRLFPGLAEAHDHPANTPALRWGV